MTSRTPEESIVQRRREGGRAPRALCSLGVALLLAGCGGLQAAPDPSSREGTAEPISSSRTPGTPMDGRIEKPAVAVSVDPPRARVGDRVRLSATVDVAEGTVVTLPAAIKVDDKLGPFRILEAEASGRTVRVILTPEETGEIEIPSFELRCRLPAGGERTATVPATRITVASVVGEGDASLADLKPPAEFPVPWPWKTILFAAAGAALLCGAAVWLNRRLKRPPRSPVLPERRLAPGVTPDAWARAELESLLSRRLVEAGRFREFHIGLADLLRQYVELRYRVPALERTTDEVREELAGALVAGETAQSAHEILARCDRVKFAKYIPDSREVTESVRLCREFIERAAVTEARVVIETDSVTAESVS